MQYKELYFSDGIGIEKFTLQMSELFIENPQYKLMDYEPITNGLRFYYVALQ